MITRRYHFYMRDGRWRVCDVYDGRPCKMVCPLPAAIWRFDTIRAAQLAVRCWEHARYNAPRFWDLYWRVTGLWEQSRKEREARAAVSGFTVRRIDRHTFVWEHGFKWRHPFPSVPVAP